MSVHRTTSATDGLEEPGVPGTEPIAGGAPSKRRGFLRRFAQHKLAMGAALVMLVLIGLAVLAPLVAPKGPTALNIPQKNHPPNSEHWLGTDELGRDSWARLVYGGRVSMSVGLIAVAIYITIGTILGCLSGYYGGAIDSIVQRITDTFMSFPSIILIMTLVLVFGASIINVILAIALFRWTGTCRLVRAQVLSIREWDFVSAARCIGASDGRIMLRHILPNALAPLVVSATFGVAASILAETGLSFLGLGIQPPTPSWGNMLTSALKISVLEQRVWQWLPPGGIIAVCVLCINFIGDGLRDAIDPHSHQHD